MVGSTGGLLCGCLLALAICKEGAGRRRGHDRGGRRKVGAGAAISATTDFGLLLYQSKSCTHPTNNNKVH